MSEQVKIEVTLDQIKALSELCFTEYRSGDMYLQTDIRVVQETEIHKHTVDNIVVGMTPFYRFFLVFGEGL